MSAIHLAQISKRLNEQFAKYIDRADLNDKDPEITTKILARCLAAHAVFMRSGCASIDAALSVTDGGDDHGLDAIYFSPAAEKLFSQGFPFLRSTTKESSLREQPFEESPSRIRAGLDRSDGIRKELAPKALTISRRWIRGCWSGGIIERSSRCGAIAYSQIELCLNVPARVGNDLRRCQAALGIWKRIAVTSRCTLRFVTR